MIRLLTTLLAALAVTGSARAEDGSLGMHLGAFPVKATREACGRKAVAALVAEKFPYAEVTPEDHVRGWNDQTAVHVYTFPTPDPDQVMIFLFAASTSDAEAGRLRNTLRTSIIESKDDPKSPTRFVPGDGKVPPAPVSVCFKSEEKSVTPVVKHFAAAATIVMEKRGMSTQIQGTQLVFGTGAGGLSAAFIAPSSSGVAVKFNSVTAVRGDKPAEKLAEDVLSKVVKILCE